MTHFAIFPFIYPPLTAIFEQSDQVNFEKKNSVMASKVSFKGPYCNFYTFSLVSMVIGPTDSQDIIWCWRMVIISVKHGTGPPKNVIWLQNHIVRVDKLFWKLLHSSENVIWTHQSMWKFSKCLGQIHGSLGN